MKFYSKKFFIYALGIVLIAVILFSCFNTKHIVEGNENYNYRTLSDNLNKALSVYDSNYNKLNINLSSYATKKTPDLYNKTLTELKQNKQFINLQNACKPFNTSDCSATGVCQFTIRTNGSFCDVKLPSYIGKM